MTEEEQPKGEPAEKPAPTPKAKAKTKEKALSPAEEILRKKREAQQAKAAQDHATSRKHKQGPPGGHDPGFGRSRTRVKK